MKTRNVIKKSINEVAGISFEVRKWAQIIENYVKDYIAAERAKMPKQTYTKPQTQEPKKYNTPAVVPPKEEEVYDDGLDFTHFESHSGDVYASAKVYGYDLYINSDVLNDFPNIKKVIQDKLFEIEFDGEEGGFFVDTVGSNFPDDYLDGIIEMIEDHMTMGEAFYTDNYEEVFAAVADEETFSNYSVFMEDMERPALRDYESRYGGYYSYTPQPKIDKIEINGKDFPDAYEDFKVDKWVITPSNRIEYDHWKSGYDESGDYVVYLNMMLSSVGGSALIHEVKHAYDDWNRMSRGAQPIRAGWEIKNIYTPDFEKLVLGASSKLSPMLSPIIRYYYLGSKLETPAYLENEYDSSQFGSYRDTAKKMMNFKASNFLDKDGNPARGLQDSWTYLINNYDIPFFRKFKQVVDFLNYTEKHFNKRGRDILRRIDKMSYVHNRPMTRYQPKTYVKPTQVTPQTPTQTSSVGSAYEKLDAEITKLEAEWDKKYGEYLKDKDPKKRKELDELDTIINELLYKLNNMSSRF
jgi:hypothetical protein